MYDTTAGCAPSLATDSRPFLFSSSSPFGHYPYPPQPLSPQLEVAPPILSRVVVEARLTNVDGQEVWVRSEPVDVVGGVIGGESDADINQLLTLPLMSRMGMEGGKGVEGFNGKIYFNLYDEVVTMR